MASSSSAPSQGDEAGGSVFCGLYRAQSMQVMNDPRFFAENVISYRLDALGELAVVSGLMIDTCMGAVMEMDKRMRPDEWHSGVFQFVSFVLVCIVFFFNMLSTYIGVAQPYHTIRLLTSGPTGFEAASQYYLNKNIVAWRHWAVNAMLVSLPIFLLSCGLRLISKFDRGNRQRTELPEHTPSWAWWAGRGFAGALVLLGLLLLFIHWTHFAVFKERYKNRGLEPGYQEYARNLSSLTKSRGAQKSRPPLDV
mmetsp:Transcript_45075/g.107113  ORF Transcript_45075/g.107113 Transcript_45075/m.107113 type:complete len:252 (-) Transcript_45075:178-933(-)